MFSRYKYLIFCTMASVIFYLIAFDQRTKHATTENGCGEILKPKAKGNETMKYILIWTLPNTKPFVTLGKGQTAFNLKNCSQKNCYVTSQRKYFKDIRKFQAILFHGPEVTRSDVIPPLIRTPNQIYVFGSIESSHYYPLCKPKYNDFFNWTWTYKLHSDLRFQYVVVRDKIGRVVGPNEVMHWQTNEEMLPISDEVQKKLQSKRKAAAWVVSNCNSKSKREKFVKDFDKELARFGLFVDVFGRCGKFQCQDRIKPDCWATIQSDYYFYLSFENSFSEDYVTEKLVNALQHYTVPIVFGSANYTRFMPEGSYLNAMQLGPVKLAKEVKYIMQNKSVYYNFFRWRNHYTYHNPEEDPSTDHVCRLCEAIHDADPTKRTQHKDFTKWWNDSPAKC